MKFSQSNSPEEATFDCDLCGQEIAIDARAGGTEVSCPYCDGEIVVPDFQKSEDNRGDIKKVPSTTQSALPSPRKEGESPKVPVLGEGTSELPSYRFTRASPSPVDSVAMVAAISRGELEILKSRKIGSRHVAFGCPFCAKPIEIKLKQQGKPLQCVECSGKMIAPDHDAGIEAQPVSGQGGVAGEKKINLPGIKTKSLQKTDHRRHPSTAAIGEGEGLEENITEESLPVTGKDGGRSSIHRLNNDRETKFVPRDAVEAAKGMEKQWDESWGMMIEGQQQSQSAQRFLGRRRFRLFAMIIMIASMVLIVVMSLKRSNLMKGEVGADGRGQGDDFGLREPAQKAISLSGKFSLLSTVNQRLKYVRHPNSSLTRMKKYYAVVLNNTVFPALDFKSYQATKINGIRFARMTSIVDSEARQREFFFELPDDGELLLDWESAVGYCDVDIMEYSRDPVSGPVQMRVLVKPADYYAFEFANADAFDCYEITDLTSRVRIYGYVESVSAIAENLRKLHDNEREGQKGFVYCTLVLNASEAVDSRGAPQVRIKKMLKDSWLLP